MLTISRSKQAEVWTRVMGSREALAEGEDLSWVVQNRLAVPKEQSQIPGGSANASQPIPGMEYCSRHSWACSLVTAEEHMPFAARAPLARQGTNATKTSAHGGTVQAEGPRRHSGAQLACSADGLRTLSVVTSRGHTAEASREDRTWVAYTGADAGVCRLERPVGETVLGEGVDDGADGEVAGVEGAVQG
jgi:hypothetical protein